MLVPGLDWCAVYYDPESDYTEYIRLEDVVVFKESMYDGSVILDGFLPDGEKIRSKPNFLGFYAPNGNISLEHYRSAALLRKRQEDEDIYGN